VQRRCLRASVETVPLVRSTVLVQLAIMPLKSWCCQLPPDPSHRVHSLGTLTHTHTHTYIHTYTDTHRLTHTHTQTHYEVLKVSHNAAELCSWIPKIVWEHSKAAILLILAEMLFYGLLRREVWAGSETMYIHQWEYSLDPDTDSRSWIFIKIRSLFRRYKANCRKCPISQCWRILLKNACIQIRRQMTSTI